MKSIIVKLTQISLLTLLGVVSPYSLAEELISIDRLVQSPERFFGKNVRVKGRLHDFPNLNLTSERSTIAVYTLKDMDFLFAQGKVGNERCAVVEGMFNYSKIHKQYYIEEKMIHACREY